MNNRHVLLNRFATLLGLLVTSAFLSGAQSTQVDSRDSSAVLQNLLSDLRDLKSAVADMRGQLADSRRETEQLRKDLDAARQQVDLLSRTRTQPEASGDPAEEQQLLAAKVADQYQTKVESSSKYRVRLSGMALMNLSSTRGAVNDIDVPETALPRAPGDSPGSFGATVRQSVIGLEVFGPDIAGAKTSGEVRFDFFGGFPATTNNATAGIVRLRTAKIRMDWEKTSLVGGQDTIFFSPLSPSSLAASAYPALGSAGNLWTWTPQFYVERRTPLAHNFNFVLQGGILDPLAGEISGEYDRQPGAGERTSIPAIAARTALQRSFGDRSFQVGAGGYYARHDWGLGRKTDAWAATLDWDLPLGNRLALSGEAYRGREIAGLGGTPGGSVLAIPSSFATAPLIPLDGAGGWAQLKLRATSRLDFNAAFGESYAFRTGLNRLLAGRPLDAAPPNRNSSGFFNAIYQPRSNLMFSAEYRRLWTSGFNLPVQHAGHITLSGGIIF